MNDILAGLYWLLTNIAANLANKRRENVNPNVQKLSIIVKWIYLIQRSKKKL